MPNQRRRPVLTLPPLLALLAFGSMGADKGCANAQDSSNVAQDAIVAQEWVIYDARTDKTTARATFRFGNDLGTVLQLQPPAQVTFGPSGPLAFDANWGWHHVDLAGRVDAGTFVFRDDASVEHRTTVPAFAATELPAVARLPRASASMLAWQGAALADGETVEVFLASTANRANIVRFATSAAGATAVVLTPDLLAQLPPGGVVVSLNRHRTLRPDARTKVTTTWAAHDATATLE